MKKSCLAVVCLLFFATQIYALPRFALLRGEGNCLGCHVNPTGGGLRTEGGESFSINDLPMWKRGGKFSGQISDAIRIGGDFSSQFLIFSQTSPRYSFSDSLNSNQPKRHDTTTKVSAFNAMNLSFEMAIKATNTLHGYLRYDALGAVPAEGWAMLHVVHSSGEIIQAGDVVNNAYIKFGAFLPVFGIRFDDHTVYVKGGSASLSGFKHAGFFWSPGYRDIGVEIGTLLFDHIGIEAGIFNGSESHPSSNFGTDPLNNKAFCFRITSSGELIENMLAGEIGFSSYIHNHTNDNGAPANMTLTGLHCSLRAGPVTILGEYDFGHNVIISGARTVAKSANALCLEGAVRIVKGLDIILRYETFSDKIDPGDGTIITGTEVKGRYSFGAQWFPLRFLEIRPEYRIAKPTAPNAFDTTITDNFTENTFLILTHVFF